MPPLLLDTCALIWLVQGEPFSPLAVSLLNTGADAGAPVYISPISAWELGLLVAKRRMKLSLTPQAFFRRALEVKGTRLASISPELLIESSFLPGKPPRDPADRIIAATARDLGCNLMTRDRALLDYGEQGHVSVIEC